MNGWKNHMSCDSQLYRRGKFLSPYFRVRQIVVCTFHKLFLKSTRKETGKTETLHSCFDFKIRVLKLTRVSTSPLRRPLIFFK